MGWLSDLLRSPIPAPRRHPVMVEPLSSPRFQPVQGEAPVKPTVGRCDQVGHFYDRDGGCIYCGEAT